MNVIICLAVFFPIVCGLLILFFPGLKKRKELLFVSLLSLVVSMLYALAVIAGGEAELHLLRFGGSLEVYFHVDPLGRLFAVVITVVWLMAGIFSCEYMKHEKEEKRYFGFYVLVYGVLMALCFFGSMFITNDVALITFVPFAVMTLEMAGQSKRLIHVVVLQTIAANLGSMLTPIGNPQNLYLYGRAGMSLGSFLGLMLPYTAVSLLLLLAWGMFLGGSCADGGKPPAEEFQGWEAGHLREKTNMSSLWIYLALFLLCLLTVAHVLPWQMVLGSVLAAVVFRDRKLLAKVDYSLLLTFVGFFIFIGNVGRIPAFRDFLQNAVAGREVFAGVAASQVISNVPAALLLSGFTEDYGRLLVGVNLGGLGTLIASMASLMSLSKSSSEGAV